MIVGSGNYSEPWKSCWIRKNWLSDSEEKNDADPCTKRLENLCCWKTNAAGLFEKLFADLNGLPCVKYLDPGKLMRIRTYGSSDRKVPRMRQWRRLRWKRRPEPMKRGSEIRFQVGFGSASEKVVGSASKKVRICAFTWWVPVPTYPTWLRHCGELLVWFVYWNKEL